MKRKNRLSPILVAVAVAAGVVAAYYGPSLLRLARVVRLYEEGRIVGNFLNMKELFPVSTVRAGALPFALRREPIPLPENFEFRGRVRDTAEYLDYSRSTGLIVLHGDTIAYENYWLGHGEAGHHISWSVAKSFVSALIGIALAEGRFASIEDPITRYLPELAGSGYDGVAIRDILQMSSGVRFNEDYGDFYSDINRFGRILALGGSMAEFAASLQRERPPGTFHHYVSIDTQVLGMLLDRVCGTTLTEYTERKLWQPIGMERDAFWLLDNTGMEVALGGLNASLRDYARFGLLYLNRGRWRGEQIVPEDWVRASTTASAPHLLPGADNPASSSTWGYGYQWWIPDPDMGDYTAAGIYNQYIYVNPRAQVVIAKNSANHRFVAEREESKQLHVALFRAIAAHIAAR